MSLLAHTEKHCFLHLDRAGKCTIFHDYGWRMASWSIVAKLVGAILPRPFRTLRSSVAMLLQAGTRVQGGEQARTRDALAWLVASARLSS